MDVYQASDGGLFHFDRYLGDYEALEDLLEDIGSQLGLAPANVLLFMEDGREVRAEVLEEAWAQAGPSTPSMGSKIKLYMYNRESFWGDAEQWALQFQEELQMPPPLDQTQLHNLAQVQHPFLVAYDHVSHLQSLYQAQARALEIAYSNLSQHLQPLIDEFTHFAQRAEKELSTEAGLIRGAGLDMALLPKISINPVLLKRKDSSEEKVKTLGDYVNPRKMEQVRDSCRTTYEDHAQRYYMAMSRLDEIQIQADAETRACNESAAMVGAEFSEGLARLEIATGHLSDLLGSGSDDVTGDLLELDNAMREDLQALTVMKNDFTLEVHLHLHQIAQFQTRIPDFTNPMRDLEHDLQDKSAFPHLYRLRQLPFAYATAVAEVVRRNEYSRLLIEWAKRLEDTLGRFTLTERKRREHVQAEVIAQLPFPLAIGTDEQGPRVEVSVITGAESLRGVKFGQEEIEKLVTWVEGLKETPEILAAIEEGDEDHLEVLQASIEGLLGKIDFASEELDKMIEQSVLLTQSKPRSGSNSRLTMNLSTQLHTANQERAEQEKRIAEMQAAHEEQMRETTEQYEQRLDVAQNRQGELQDELVRLRTDLSEEMMARQALSAELLERSREQEEKVRDYEDQADFVRGLQAELSQEKDRATDLGVRLQEALLDVDGLRSADQTLQAQIQELQEERTRSLGSLGEAQSYAQGLESQLAGLRAELEATTQQLVQAQADRDVTLKNQSAEAERLMRDHIAETDGDRAVLEHQNLTLTKQLDDIRVELEEKVSATRNAAVRQADGLKAELSFTKAQLRESQRRETVLTDELAMAKDTTTAITQENSYQSDVSRDAVALASRYHETCQRLLNAINMSTTISGTAGSQHVTTLRARSPPRAGDRAGASASATLSTSSRDEMRESVLVRSLATAQGFDLVGFAEAVTKTIGLVKKWSKSCRTFRDQARNKISFTNFAKGDLALFLPTRNAAARSWAAFNVSAPHNFLKVAEGLQKQIKTREWIIARIVKTEEAIASGGESPITNPFGLADGLRYYTHHVEEYNPHAVRPPRKSTERDASVSQMLASPTRMTPGLGSAPLDSIAGMENALSASGKTPMPSRGRSSSGYFPPISVLATSNRIEAALSSEARNGMPSVADVNGTSIEVVPSSQVEEPPVYEGLDAPAAKAQDGAESTFNSRVVADPYGSPLGFMSKPSVTLPASASGPLPPAPSSSPVVPTVPASGAASAIVEPVPGTTSVARATHSRQGSHGTPRSPTPASRDIPFALNPASIVRPSSSASSASSYPKALTIGPSGGKGALAPAMATTSSTSSANNKGKERSDDFQRTVSRKPSETVSVSVSPGSHGSPSKYSPLVPPSQRSRRGSAPRVTDMAVSQNQTLQPASSASPSELSPDPSAGLTGGFSTLGVGTGGKAGKFIKGFTIGRKSSMGLQPSPVTSPTDESSQAHSQTQVKSQIHTSAQAHTDQTVSRGSTGPAGVERPPLAGRVKEDRRPSAMDMLRRFESNS
ncbi:hypothetical protein IAU60_001360 [Kwoniella sp. DSM 27419]